MAQSTKVAENVTLEVQEKSRRGTGGTTYKVKFVKYKDKDYEVGKTSKDKVKIGGEYAFELSKSEYNDKIYYWANLQNNSTARDCGEDNEPEFNRPENRVRSYLMALPIKKKIAIIKWILDKIEAEIKIIED